MPAAAARDSGLLSSVIAFSDTGDNILVSGATNKSVRVYRIFFTVSADTNLIVKNGVTALTGTITMYAGGTFVLDVSNEPWFIITSGNSFVINQSGTATVGGKFDYHRSP